MARNTLILLGDYFENFVNEQVASGKYSSVNEVIRAALRIFEQEENKAKTIETRLND
ncbi:type II toxin-antitoxin system ParD family antitoxin [Bacteroidales bacterium OttesenSCG-928-I21]|nr:type II toxin-antitoxin system ParD family antitoxin [Bacteroidales bacterium OttesenSCG-928-I21]